MNKKKTPKKNISITPKEAEGLKDVYYAAKKKLGEFGKKIGDVLGKAKQSKIISRTADKIGSLPVIGSTPLGEIARDVGATAKQFGYGQKVNIKQMSGKGKAGKLPR